MVTIEGMSESHTHILGTAVDFYFKVNEVKWSQLKHSLIAPFCREESTYKIFT